jgi:hypothetical protein
MVGVNSALRLGMRSPTRKQAAQDTYTVVLTVMFMSYCTMQ